MRCLRCNYWENCKCYSCKNFKTCEYASACINDFIHVNADKTQSCNDYEYSKEIEECFK